MEATERDIARYATVAEAGEILRVPRSTIARWMASGQLQSAKLGGRRLISHDVLRDVASRPGSVHGFIKADWEALVQRRVAESAAQSDVPQTLTDTSVLERISVLLGRYSDGAPFGGALPHEAPIGDQQ